VQGLSNRLSQDRQDVERLTKENARSFERKQQKIQEKQKAVADIASLEHSLVSLRQDQAAQIEHRTALEKVRDGVREEYNGRLMEVEDLRKNVKTDQTQFEEISNQVHTVELDQTRDEQEQRRIRERMWESYGPAEHRNAARTYQTRR
jgi:hypothetical protein